MADHLVQVPGGNVGDTAMANLLAALAPEAESLDWSIRDHIEAVGGPLYAMSRSASSTPCGMEVTYAQLCAVASQTGQVINGTFAATVPGSPRIPLGVDDRALVDQAAMVLAAFDNIFWFVAASEPVITRLRRRFDGVVDGALLGGGLTA